MVASIVPGWPQREPSHAIRALSATALVLRARPAEDCSSVRRPPNLARLTRTGSPRPSPPALTLLQSFLRPAMTAADRIKLKGLVRLAVHLMPRLLSPAAARSGSLLRSAPTPPPPPRRCRRPARRGRCRPPGSPRSSSCRPCAPCCARRTRRSVALSENRAGGYSA